MHNKEIWIFWSVFWPKTLFLKKFSCGQIFLKGPVYNPNSRVNCQQLFCLWADLAEIFCVVPWAQGASKGPQMEFPALLYFHGKIEKRTSRGPIELKFSQGVPMDPRTNLGGSNGV